MSILSRVLTKFWTESGSCAVSGGAVALSIVAAAQQHDGPVLVLCNDNQAANQLEDDIRFFLRNQPNAPEVLSFTDWEILPYDHFSPHQDIISQRLTVLHEIPLLKKAIIIVSVTTVMQRLSPCEFIDKFTFAFAIGQTLDRNKFRDRLQRIGYRHCSQVMEHGEFCFRGSIVDIYPMGSKLPIRIDFFDEEIDSIRTFDPENQCSIAKLDRITLLPAREFPLDDVAIQLFRQQWRSHFAGNPTLCAIYEDVSQGLIPAGVEYYLPLFFEQCQDFFVYLAPETLVIRYSGAGNAADQFWQDINVRYQQYNSDITRPLLPPDEVFLNSTELFTQLNRFTQIKIEQNQDDSLFPEVYINNKAKNPVQGIQKFLQQRTTRVLFCAESLGRQEMLRKLFAEYGTQLQPIDNWQDFLTNNALDLAIVTGGLSQGLHHEEAGLTIITETELFKEHVSYKQRRYRRSIDADAVIKDLIELQIGSPVVHVNYGVGRYRGLEILDIDDIATEFLHLEYAVQDRIYVPVTSLELICRYTGADADNAPLHKLGSKKWQREKQKAAEKIRDVATELLELYARREAQKGFCFSNVTDSYQTFVNGFPFEETPDQARAIDEVKCDMLSDKSMDRLVCGDVGFGKTEVALRAAFIAVENGKQVAMLVPTTLLANQHYNSFQDRFAEFPVRIAMLSRMVTAKQQKVNLQEIEDGKIDIVIGTHKLLQKDIKFKDLGLLIVDEEHRFGVRQKERIKSMRSNVDILTLTATPIPRTLNMAMSGLRDISLIMTPPARRLSIKTFVQERNRQTIREAISREMLRGGQIFFLHNTIETMSKIVDEVQQLVPQAKIKIAHGQMAERELEKIMVDFYHVRFHVLVCSTIIETGIDIPTVNTIIIDRADRFGLAQLHQLRGRVGRSHHQAYAYLMTPGQTIMTKDAKKRLQAICSLEDLGAGFTLATHDLEIRGAGELLGEEQSGSIGSLGFELYMDLLDRTIKAMQAGEQIEFIDSMESGCEINLNISAIIPDNYVPDVQQRLTLYKRFAGAESEAELDKLQVELIDRFGLLPEPVKHLVRINELKQIANKMGIKEIIMKQQIGVIKFSEDPKIDHNVVLGLIQTKPKLYQLKGTQQLQFNSNVQTIEEKFAGIHKLLRLLSGS